MKIEKTKLPGILLITPDVFLDNRGYFFESYNLQKYTDVPDFIQDIESKSNKNVLRGLHYQIPPFAQGKLIRVSSGKILDVMVDIRCDSSTFGQYFSIELSEYNKKQVYIPPGFAHGFITISNEAIIQYKCTNFYNKESERGIMWDDSDLAIDWNTTNPIISDKDKNHKRFKEIREEIKSFSSEKWKRKN